MHPTSPAPSTGADPCTCSCLFPRLPSEAMMPTLVFRVFKNIPLQLLVYIVVSPNHNLPGWPSHDCHVPRHGSIAIPASYK